MDRKQLIASCLAELSASRINAQNKAVSFLMKAREIPEFNQLDKEERALTFEIGKLRAENKNTTEQNKNLQLIKEKKEHILLKNNISPDSLSAKYSCMKCQDTGYVNGTFCKCLQNKVREKILKDCGVENKKLCSFKEFKPDLATDEKQKSQLLKVKDIFEKVADKYPLINQNFIVVSGKTGVGKTFMTECLASKLIDKGFIVSFVSAFGMNKLMLSYHTCFDQNKQSYLDALIDPDVLIIDDLGTEPVLKNVTLEYLYVVLSERSRLGHLTVVTTNLGSSEILDRYNERIFSRLVNKRESMLIQIQGEDLRCKSAK